LIVGCKIEVKMSALPRSASARACLAHAFVPSPSSRPLQRR